MDAGRLRCVSLTVVLHQLAVEVGLQQQPAAVCVDPQRFLRYKGGPERAVSVKRLGE
jgi:hypothetical protein